MRAPWTSTGWTFRSITATWPTRPPPSWPTSRNTPRGVHLEITKRVPVAGGMGGGSADAAATLLACDALWNSGLSRDELAHLAAELGADVPFALLGGTAVGLGLGDDLSPALVKAQTDWVLVSADFGLSTPEVYRTLDRLRAAEGRGGGRTRRRGSRRAHGSAQRRRRRPEPRPGQRPPARLDRTGPGPARDPGPRRGLRRDRRHRLRLRTHRRVPRAQPRRGRRTRRRAAGTTASTPWRCTGRCTGPASSPIRSFRSF